LPIEHRGGIVKASHLVGNREISRRDGVFLLAFAATVKMGCLHKGRWLMDARAKTVREILHSGDQYLIPLFQRHYSWTKKHWDRLWADIRALEDAEADNQHFLGPLVCTPARAMARCARERRGPSIG
jgi:hypothetical protein